MQYFEFVTTINPFVLGVLALVICVGMYDHFVAHK